MITITIPDIPPSLNKWSRMHWSKAAEIKRKWEADVYYLAYSQRPKEPFKYAKITITYYFKDKRRRDIVDNYSPKFLMDGLVKAKILLDDRTEYVGIPELIMAYDKKNSRTEIKIIQEVKS